MVLINGVKFSCTPCIKGHRSANCVHPDRPLTEIKKKGRPPAQCPKCRELRKSKTGTKCQCLRPAPATIPAQKERGDLLSSPILAGTSTLADPTAFPIERPPSHDPSFYQASLGQTLSTHSLQPSLLEQYSRGDPIASTSNLSTRDSVRSFSLSPPADPSADDLAVVGRKKSVAGSRRKDVKRAMRPHELSHGHMSDHGHGAGRAAPYPYPFPVSASAGSGAGSAWNGSEGHGSEAGWSPVDAMRMGLVTPPPSISQLSDYSESIASASTFSLSSYGADSASSHDEQDLDGVESNFSLAHALDRELNFVSADDIESAHSSALYRSLEHVLNANPALAHPHHPNQTQQQYQTFELPPDPLANPPPQPSPSVTFPDNVNSPPPPTSISFHPDLSSQLLLSRTRSRDTTSVTFARHSSLALDRDRDRTLDASLALDRDRDRTLGRELSLDRDRDLTFKSTSTGGSVRKLGFKNLVSKVKEWGKKGKDKGKEKDREKDKEKREKERLTISRAISSSTVSGVSGWPFSQQSAETPPPPDATSYIPQPPPPISNIYPPASTSTPSSNSHTNTNSPILNNNPEWSNPPSQQPPEPSAITRIKTEEVDSLRGLTPPNSHSPDEPSPQGTTRSFEELLWETIGEVEVVHHVKSEGVGEYGGMKNGASPGDVEMMQDTGEWMGSHSSTTMAASSNGGGSEIAWSPSPLPQFSGVPQAPATALPPTSAEDFASLFAAAASAVPSHSLAQTQNGGLSDTYIPPGHGEWYTLPLQDGGPIVNPNVNGNGHFALSPDFTLPNSGVGMGEEGSFSFLYPQGWSQASPPGSNGDVKMELGSPVMSGNLNGMGNVYGSGEEVLKFGRDGFS